MAYHPSLERADNEILLPNVNSKILSKVTANSEGLKNWATEFIKVHQATLFEVTYCPAPYSLHVDALFIA
jgi:hypothetical protein